MKITSVEFIKGIIGTDTIIHNGIPQVVFIGRSNVGKSSVINSLVNRKNLVKSSATPGKTQQINFFLVNDSIYFVDLPGYGFAKISEKRREKLRKLILWYLLDSGVKVSRIILVIDAKVGPTQFDIEMLELLNENDYDVTVVANKVDKLKKNDQIKQFTVIKDELSFNKVILYSTKTKIGRRELLKEIFGSLN